MSVSWQPWLQPELRDFVRSLMSVFLCMVRTIGMRMIFLSLHPDRSADGPAVSNDSEHNLERVRM